MVRKRSFSLEQRMIYYTLTLGIFFQGLHFVARNDIQAGSELFEDYGESYFSMRPHKYANIPLQRDYEQANNLLMQLDEIITEYTDNDFSSRLAQNVWNMITTTLTRPPEAARPMIQALPESLVDAVRILKGNGKSVNALGIHFAIIYGSSSAQVAQKAWEMLRTLVEFDKPERLVKALPKNLSDVPLAIELGTAKFSLVGHSDARSLDWLATHGRCIDNLQPGKSEIPQAGGHGAFATRRMKKGQVVAPIPVAQGLRKQMELYNVANPNNGNPDGRFVLVRHQLILNYAFGHPESSLLLFPYGPVVSYLNHNSTAYNAELKWSDLATHRSDWLEKSPNEISQIDELGLVLELVATRDIEAGEEVLIDYGSKWEAAWQDHVAHWRPPSNKLVASYVSAATLNARHEWLRTRAELLLRPYPDNVQTICFVAGRVNDDESQGMAGATDWVDLGERLLSHTKSAIPCQVWERVIIREGGELKEKEEHVTMQEFWAMDASERDTTVTYNVKVLRKDGNFFMKGLPRRAIQFFDKQYTSDQFLTNAFRHEMHLPDHLVPAVWRDLKRG
jgi:SET domain